MLWKLPEISLTPEVLFHIGPFGITNTLICTWICILAIITVLFFGTRKRDMIPSGIQNFVEWSIELLMGLVDSVAGKEKGRRFFPLIATFFIFVLFANLLDVLPGVDTLGSIRADKLAVHGATQPFLGFLLYGNTSNAVVPWLRPPTTDLNVTLSLALVSVVVTQVFGFIYLGAGGQLSKYINFKGFIKDGKFTGLGFIDLAIGLVEIISEIARLISFSVRLFGNIFAGSILLAVFAFLVPAFANIIFIPLELFVAFIQAFVFALLSLVFMQVGSVSHDDHTESEHDAREETEVAEARREAVATH